MTNASLSLSFNLFRRSTLLCAWVTVLLAAPPSQAALRACQTLRSERCHVMLSTGITMAYLETGPPSGPPIILIHGFADNLRTWVPAMEALRLRDSSWHIFAVDLRGHGQSSMPSSRMCAEVPEQCFRVKDFAEDILAFMRDRDIPRAALAGHSLGSLVVQELALDYPEKVTKAILVATTTQSTSIVPTVQDLLKQIESVWAKPGVTVGHRFPRDFYLMTPVEAGPQALRYLSENWCPDPIVRAYIIKPFCDEAARIPLGTWIGGLRTLLAFDNTARLSGLRVPTLVIWGSQDVAFHLMPDQERIRAVLSAAAHTYGTISYWKQYGVRALPPSGQQETDIGHEAQWEAPKTTAADIDSFLKTGAPTLDLPHSDALHVNRIIVDNGKARVLKLRS